jgi:hypothetical protein
MKNFKPVLFAVLLASQPVFAGTQIDLESDQGDYIGQGKTYSYNDENASISYSRNYDNGIRVRISNLPGQPWLSWDLNIAAAENAEIIPGQYTSATRFPFQSSNDPGLSFSGQGRGCNKLTGSFEVYDVAYDDKGEVTALDMSFEQHCEGGASALRGKVSFNTIPPVGVSAIGLKPSRVVCKNKTTQQKVKGTVADSIVDCRKLGLDIRAGDEVKIKMVGTAE